MKDTSADTDIPASIETPETTKLVIDLPHSIISSSGSGTTANATFRNFLFFSAVFSAVPAAALACLSLASARLGSVGAWQSGVLYLTYTLSSVTGATYIVNKWGSRDAMILGMFLYNMYVACFLLATLFPNGEMVLAWSGAAMGGIGAGVFWTAQGVYFSQAAELYALESGMDWERSTASLAGYFAFILLLEETLVDLSSSFFVKILGVPWSVMFGSYLVVGLLGMIGMAKVKKHSTVHDKNDHGKSAVCRKITAAFRLLITDSKMKYMIGFNSAFGFAAAFLNSFVSGVVLPIALDDTNSSYVGLLVAIHGFSAALASLAFGRISHQIGKGSILILGSLAFAGVALPFLIQPDLQRWTLGSITLIYVLEGVGRATFEGTLKAIFADYFCYETEGAFASIIMQNGISSAVAYVLSFQLRCSAVSDYCIDDRKGNVHNLLAFGSIVVMCSVLSIFGYWRAAYLFHHGSTGKKVSTYRSQAIQSYSSSKISPIHEKMDHCSYDAVETVNLPAFS